MLFKDIKDIFYILSRLAYIVFVVPILWILMYIIGGFNWLWYWLSFGVKYEIERYFLLRSVRKYEAKKAKKKAEKPEKVIHAMRVDS
ncbi:hypothetical protein ACE193_15420 [Bernardetia sp. OM2101]|uniref:hypothetical protein n=1 Tax=Bernardetia sp. OM2101 TaxID=3344876 RepID=UPI0035CFB46F